MAEGDQLAQAVARAVATGGSVLDPKIVEAMVHPVTRPSCRVRTRSCCDLVAEGRPIKAIAAAAQNTTPAAAAEHGREALLAPGPAGQHRRQPFACAGCASCTTAIVARDEQERSLSRLLPGWRRRRLLVRQGGKIGETEELDVSVIIMSDIRGYSTIAEHADPAAARPAS